MENKTISTKTRLSFTFALISSLSTAALIVMLALGDDSGWGLLAAVPIYVIEILPLTLISLTISMFANKEISSEKASGKILLKTTWILMTFNFLSAIIAIIFFSYKFAN